MPRTKLSAQKSTLAAAAAAKVAASKAKAAVKSKGSVSSAEVKKKKAKRFRNVTLAVRSIRRMQRDTSLAIRKAPMTRLVRQCTIDYDAQTWLRPRTVEALQQIVDAALVGIMRQALDRRIESLTEAEHKKQTAVQVMGKHLIGAFQVWCDFHPCGEFKEALKRNLEEEPF